MELINNVSDVLHSLRVNLLPNYLKDKTGGDYIARTSSEATLSVEQVCATLIKRGGYSGRYEDLVTAVKGFMNEAAYQLCDGYTINTGYYSIIPGVGGTFTSAAEVNDRKKHPISFSFQARAALRRLARSITVKVDGVAENTAWIDSFVDINTNTVNETLTPGSAFIIRGHKIKVVGDDGEAGVYFESVTDDGRRVKATDSLIENTASKIIGMVPTLVAPRNYRVVVVSRFTGGSNLLKKPRTITSPFTLSIE